MTDESTGKKKVYEGEVLAPGGRSAPAVPDLPRGAPFGISLFARAKFEAQARAFRAHAEFRRAQRESIEAETGLMGAAQDRFLAEESLARAITRQKHLGKILDADEARLLAELDDVFEGIEAAKAAGRERAEDQALLRRAAKAKLEAEALEAEARLERLRNPPPEPAPQGDSDGGLTRPQKIAREIKRVKRDGEELKAAIIEAAGGEDRLSDDDREQLDLIELWVKDQIRTTMESV